MTSSEIVSAGDGRGRTRTRPRSKRSQVRHSRPARRLRVSTKIRFPRECHRQPRSTDALARRKRRMEVAQRVSRPRPPHGSGQRPDAPRVRGNARFARRHQRDFRPRPRSRLQYFSAPGGRHALHARLRPHSRRQRSGPPLRDRTDGRGVAARHAIHEPGPADAAGNRRQDRHRRFRFRLFFAGDVVGDHRRRIEGGPIADHRHRKSAARTKSAARHRVDRRSARHGSDG